MDFNKLFSQLVVLYNKLTKQQRIIIGSAVVGIVAFLIFMVVYTAKKDTADKYEILFETLSSEDAAKVVAQLEAENIPLDIVYEDANVIVVNKAAGMVVHPAVGHPKGTLVNALTYHFNRLSTLQGDLRPGIIHRLDKDTSGLLMIAKDDFTHSQLAAQLSVHSITREYYAIIWGNLREDNFVIEAPIGRNPKNRQKMAVVDGGRFAKTHINLVERFSFCNLVRCRLQTGRTHQIRVHLSYYGHPVFGDEIYGGGKRYIRQIADWHRKDAKDILAVAKRQMLHAYLLGFIHPHTKKYLEFTSPMPKDMQEVLSKLRNLL